MLWAYGTCVEWRLDIPFLLGSWTCTSWGLPVAYRPFLGSLELWRVVKPERGFLILFREVTRHNEEIWTSKDLGLNRNSIIYPTMWSLASEFHPIGMKCSWSLIENKEHRWVPTATRIGMVVFISRLVWFFLVQIFLLTRVLQNNPWAGDTVHRKKGHRVSVKKYNKESKSHFSTL